MMCKNDFTGDEIDFTGAASWTGITKKATDSSLNWLFQKWLLSIIAQQDAL